MVGVCRDPAVVSVIDEDLACFSPSSSFNTIYAVDEEHLSSTWVALR
jgi:hypothetical protein